MADRIGENFLTIGALQCEKSAEDAVGGRWRSAGHPPAIARAALLMREGLEDWLDDRIEITDHDDLEPWKSACGSTPGDGTMLGVAVAAAFLASEKAWAVSGELVAASGGAGRSVYY
jgi:hypothetical protein